MFEDLVRNRKHHADVSTADRLASRTGVNRDDVIAWFKLLEQAGVGSYIVGRRGKPTRFEWTTPAVDVGRAARGEGGDVEDTAPEQAEGRAEVEATTAEADALAHHFHLREDFEVRLELPRDFDGAEADRLAKFVRTLPFEGES